MPGKLGYRSAVGVMLLSRAGEVLVARRIDMPMMPAWQMPQGGIDPGETPVQAALRELKEEIGTAAASTWLSVFGFGAISAAVVRQYSAAAPSENQLFNP